MPFKGFDEKLKSEAYQIAISDKAAGKVDFGQDGFGVARHKQERETTLRNEGYDLTSIVLEDLITQAR